MIKIIVSKFDLDAISNFRDKFFKASCETSQLELSEKFPAEYGLHSGWFVTLVHVAIVFGGQFLKRSSIFAVKCREVNVILTKRNESEIKNFPVDGAWGGFGNRQRRRRGRRRQRFLGGRSRCRFGGGQEALPPFKHCLQGLQEGGKID